MTTPSPKRISLSGLRAFTRACWEWYLASTASEEDSSQSRAQFDYWAKQVSRLTGRSFQACSRHYVLMLSGSGRDAAEARAEARRGLVSPTCTLTAFGQGWRSYPQVSLSGGPLPPSCPFGHSIPVLRAARAVPGVVFA